MAEPTPKSPTTSTEQALAEAQRRLEHVLASSPAVLYTLAPQGESFPATWISENVERLLGYTATEAMAAEWWPSHLHPEERDRVFAELRALFDHDHLTQEYRLRRRDGAYRWLRAELRLLRDSDGKPHEVVGSWSDITERMSLGAQLVRAQKMEAVAQLAGGVAHDFNNLLGVITGNTDLLMRSLPVGSQERKRGDEIKRASDRAAALTRQLLAFSRPKEISLRALDLNQVVFEVQRMVRRVISQSIDVVTIAAEGLGKVRADAGQMEQVLINLAINARDAMPAGGRLVLETGNVELDASYTGTHPDARPGRHVMLRVSDNGHGMDARTKAEGKAAGLGLGTVYGIVNRSGGTMDVRSEPGKGTTFTIYLPRVDAEAQAEARAALAAPATGGGETILVVEDGESLRLLLRELLDSAGYVVLDAEDAAKALAILASTPAPVHLVLTDMVMPHMSGVELARRLASLRPEARVVFMSGYADAPDGQEALEPGVLLLQKPFTTDALMRTIRDALDGPGSRSR